MKESAVQITDNVREGIARLFDVALPGTERLPSGRSVDAHMSLIDRVLDADPQLAPIVLGAAARATTSEKNTLDDLRNWAGEDIERLIFSLHAAYYMSSTVRISLGYPGQRRLPVSEATPDQIGSEALLAPVIERGSVYVPTPDGLLT
jgi:hypothetical protein